MTEVRNEEPRSLTPFATGHRTNFRRLINRETLQRIYSKTRTETGTVEQKPISDQQGFCRTICSTEGYSDQHGDG